MSTPVDQTLRRKLLNYRLENESNKLLITYYISKDGTIETIEIVNFDNFNGFIF